ASCRRLRTSTSPNIERVARQARGAKSARLPPSVPVPAGGCASRPLNPKPRRAYAAGASSCRVSQGGWEGRDTARYLGKELPETRTSGTQKIDGASPIGAPPAAADRL